jgi:hypothetical protein
MVRREEFGRRWSKYFKEISRDLSVGIAIKVRGWTIGVLWFDSWQGREIFFFTTMSYPIGTRG